MCIANKYYGYYYVFLSPCQTGKIPKSIHLSALNNTHNDKM